MMSGLWWRSYARVVHCGVSALLAAAALNALAAEDLDFDVSPVMTYFAPVNLGDASQPTQVVFTNTSATRALEIHGAAELSGTNADQFAIAVDECATRTLAAGNPGGNCSVWVAFSPSRYGSQMAMLSLAVNDNESQHMVAFVSSQEDVPTEAKRRLPPVLFRLDLPDLLDAQLPEQALSWSVLGYGSDYVATLALFDCTNVPAGRCGDNFDDSFWSASDLSADSVSREQAWHYRGEVSKVFNFSTRITTADLAGLDVGFSDVVARFYIKSLDDKTAQAQSTSLLVPGGLELTYYGNQGRKILLQALR